jgi:biotin carboxyl carrier protein
MKKFNVKINGKSYEVEVEELGAVQNTAPVAVAAAPAAAAVSAPVIEVKKEEPAAKPVTTTSAVPSGATVVKAPMPGTILKVNVEKGSAVKKGDTLVVLEAMKMENEIKAAADGTVVAVHTSNGTSVDTNDPLVSLA